MVDIQALAGQFLKPHQTLAMTKYFTTVVKQPEDKRRRQAVFLDALQTLPNFRIHYGQFLSETIVCRRCGHMCTTYHEKMTDVNISVEMMADASRDRFDTAFLISADSDLAGLVSTAQDLFRSKRVIAIFPPDRTSFALKRASKGALHIGHLELSRSLFPEQVKRGSLGIAGVVAPAVALLAGGSATAARTGGTPRRFPMSLKRSDRIILRRPKEWK